MRPGEANNRLAQKLEREGRLVWRWPAFRIELPENAEVVEAQLADLTGVDMVILPSPSAVAAVAHWVHSWPEHVTLATVGEGTARVIRAAWDENVKLLYPKGDAAHSGSEALWALVERRARPRAFSSCADRPDASGCPSISPPWAATSSSSAPTCAFRSNSRKSRSRT